MTPVIPRSRECGQPQSSLDRRGLVLAPPLLRAALVGGPTGRRGLSRHSGSHDAVGLHVRTSSHPQLPPPAHCGGRSRRSGRWTAPSGSPLASSAGRDLSHRRLRPLEEMARMGRCEAETDAEPDTRVRPQARGGQARFAPAPEAGPPEFASRERRALGPLDGRGPGGRSRDLRTAARPPGTSS